MVDFLQSFFAHFILCVTYDFSACCRSSELDEPAVGDELLL